MQVGTPRTIVLVLLVGAVAFSGCTSDTDAEPRTLLQESMTIGEELYRWADADYSSGSSGDTRGSAAFTVPEGVDVIGLTFQGNFIEAEERRAGLAIHDAEGDQVLERQAVPGQMDDHGAITDIWRYRSVHSVSPGEHTLNWSGTGVGLFEFTVHGIPSGATAHNETFEVPKRGGLELEFALQGWGRPPDVLLVAPDGQTTPIDIEGPHQVHTVTVPTQRGEHRLDVDTTGWGGRLLIRAVQ